MTSKSKVQIVQMPARDLDGRLEELEVGEVLVRRNPEGKYEIYVFKKDHSVSYHLHNWRWKPRQFASAEQAIKFLEGSSVPQESIAVDNGEFLWVHRNTQMMVPGTEIFSLIA